MIDQGSERRSDRGSDFPAPHTTMERKLAQIYGGVREPF